MGGDVRGSLATARSSVSRSCTATASSLVATNQAGVVAAAWTASKGSTGGGGGLRAWVALFLDFLPMAATLIDSCGRPAAAGQLLPRAGCTSGRVCTSQSRVGERSGAGAYNSCLRCVDLFCTSDASSCFCDYVSELAYRHTLGGCFFVNVLVRRATTQAGCPSHAEEPRTPDDLDARSKASCGRLAAHPLPCRRSTARRWTTSS